MPTWWELRVSQIWDDVARSFHERVQVNCWDSLATQLLALHQPHLDEGQPVCRGCDRDERGTSDPVWPCRTYTVIAATLLNVPNVESALATLVRQRSADDRRPAPGRGS
jgi:hypothetical protein